MADGHPWHKRYHSDALTGYRGLTLEQRGAYTTILDLLYDSGEDALPASDRWMAGQLDVSVRKWIAIRAELIAAGKLIETDDGRITNGRYLREQSKRRTLSATRAEAGRKGGKAIREQAEMDLGDEISTPENGVKTTRVSSFSTPENELSGGSLNSGEAQEMAENSQTLEASASDLPPVRAREPDTRDQKLDRKEITPSLDSLDLMGATKRLCDLAGISIIQPAAIARCLDVVKTWRADGLDLAQDVVPVIERDVANNPDATRYSLTFFDAAIRRAKAGARGKPTKPATGGDTAPPIADQDDDDPRIAAIRVDLRKRIGAQAYERWLKPRDVALHVNGVGLDVHTRTTFAQSRLEADHLDALRAAALAQGIDGVRVRA